MDNEKKKASKLLKKNALLNKSGVNKNKSANNKSTISSFKAVKNETKEFSLELFSNCCEITGVSVANDSNLIPLKKHINFLSHIIIQHTLRFMEQSRRGIPQVCDVDSAITLIGLETMRGVSSGEFIPLKTGNRLTDNSKSIYFKPEKEIDVKSLLFKEPSPVVYDISLVAHWLSIDGKQPACPQNPSPAFVKQMNTIFGLESSLDKNSNEDKEEMSKKSSDQLQQTCYHPRFIQTITEKRRPHEISQEVMVYFRELTEACVGAVEGKRQKALENVSIDTGLQSLLPHIVTFIAEGVRINVSNHNLAILIYLLRLIKALIDNPNISLEPHLHLLIPTVITCVLCKQLCAKPTTDNHWALRDFAAKQLVIISNKYSTASNNLYNRITKEFTRVLCEWMANVVSSSSDTPTTAKDEPDKSFLLSKGSSSSLSTSAKSHPSFNTLYGILVVFLEFGGNCMRTLLFPLFPELAGHLTNILTIPSVHGGSLSDLHNVPMGQHLPPADLRSFESLKTLIVNRIGPVLHDYRKRNSMPMTLEDYKSSYKILGTLLWNGYQVQLEKLAINQQKSIQSLQNQNQANNNQPAKSGVVRHPGTLLTVPSGQSNSTTTVIKSTTIKTE